MSDPAHLTIGELLAETSATVGPGPEARWLVEVATGLDGDALHHARTDPVTVPVVSHLDSMIGRYLAGEPLAYVLGRWAFRHLDLAVDPRVLIPRPETELVAGLAIDLARRCEPSRTVADLGTGSGAIGLALADELPLDGTTVWITDISGDALDVATANLAGIGRAARNVHVGHGSWFDPLPPGRCFDVIVSNPPYVAHGSPLLDASVRDHEPASALFGGADGLDAIGHIIENVSAHLADDGWIVLEIGADQGDSVASLMAGSGLHDVDIRPDAAGHDRIAVARCPLTR